MSEQNGPDFIVIGAQKGGTTWLHVQLNDHPDVWLPPTKEIHYFDRTYPQLPGFVTQFDSPVLAYWTRAWRTKTLRRVVNRRGDYRWLARFMGMVRTDGWYVSLFPSTNGKVTGETTPEYALLPQERVAKVHALLPHTKLIYILRNPIERIWSQAAMHFKTKAMKLDDISDPELYAYLNAEASLAHSMYMRNLATWRQFYSDDQIFVAFNEEIRNEPEALLRRVFAFLGLAPEGYIFEQAALEAQVNSRNYAALPPEVGAHLAQRLIDDLRELHTYLDNPFTAAWLADATAYLES